MVESVKSQSAQGGSMTSRRYLATTTAAAAGVLVALCFVPSASASPASAAQGTTSHAAAPAVAPAGQPAGHDLADTGAMDTTPYLVGGAGFLGIGAALLVLARRRSLMLDADAEGGLLG
jgi:LPXTG-motif cell wall-anchored protein